MKRRLFTLILAMILNRENKYYSGNYWICSSFLRWRVEARSIKFVWSPKHVRNLFK